MNKKLVAIICSTSLLLNVSYVFATNGLLPYGTGTKSKGMAGAGIALPQDAMITSQNPAGSVWVGQRYDLGVDFFMPYREAIEHDNTPAGGFILPGRYESENNFFVIPSAAVNWRIDNDKSFAVAVYAAGGVNTEYSPSPWNGGQGTTGASLKQIFITPTYSFKVNNKTSFGLSAILAVQAFEAEGLSPFARSTVSKSTDYLTDQGVDLSYGFGLRAGFHTQLNDKLTVAGAITSKIDMSKFDDYRDLFPNRGEINYPATYVLGMAYKVSNKSTVAFDIQHIKYSDVKAIGGSPTNLANCSVDVEYCFGGTNGPGFGWSDMTIYKLGYQWRGKKGWTWRAGYSKGDMPLARASFNILAPGVTEEHFTFGFTKENKAKNSEWSFAAMYAPEDSFRAVSELGQPDDVEVRMHQFALEFSWSKRFD